MLDKAEIDNIINDIITEAINIRKEKKITQKELGERCGLKQRNISKLEKQEERPSLNILLKYLDALDMKIKLVNK